MVKVNAGLEQAGTLKALHGKLSRKKSVTWKIVPQKKCYMEIFIIIKKMSKKTNPIEGRKLRSKGSIPP